VITYCQNHLDLRFNLRQALIPRHSPIRPRISRPLEPPIHMRTIAPAWRIMPENAGHQLDVVPRLVVEN
jgi:hypothetical protein